MLNWCGNLKIREMDGWRGGFVYTPETPNTVFLNATSLIVLHLAKGKQEEQARSEFINLMSDVVPETDAAASFDAALGLLKETNVVAEVPS